MNISASSLSVATRQTTQPAQTQNEPVKGVRIDITPGEDNVDTGDRSNNTLEVSVTTANREASTEITREQAANGLETRAQKRAAEQYLGSNQSLNPLTLRALQQSDVDSGDISEIATLRRQKQLAETYLNASPNNTPSNTFTPSSPSSGSGSSLYNQAVDAYIKQTLFFSAVDKAGSTISTKA